MVTCGFLLRENQNMEVMFSLGVSRCAGDIGKTNVNTTNMIVWEMGKRNVFGAVASGGAGNLLLTMNLVQTKCVFFMCSMACFFTVLGNKGCDDLRPRFCFEMVGGDL